jgi:hypothetical protein
LRNPFDRLISQHLHEIRLGRVTGHNLLLENGLVNNPSYVEQSLYWRHLVRWLNFFSLGNLRAVIFEELFDDPAKGIKEIYSFLQVDPDYQSPALWRKVNEGHVPRSRRLSSCAKYVAALMRKLGIGAALEPLKGVGLKAIFEARGSELRKYCKLAPETRSKLQEQFREENTKLGELLERDLSIWDSLADGHAS